MIIEIPIPIKGVNRTLSPDKTPAEFSDSMNNVFPRGSEKRLRLCKREGIDKWSTDQVGDAEQPVVSFCIVATSN